MNEDLASRAGAAAPRVLADRRHLWAFAAGSIAVTIGVLLHLPMFWMGRDNGFHLADMAMDAGMLVGHGDDRRRPGGRRLWPVAEEARPRVAGTATSCVAAPEDVPLGRAHWRLMMVLTIALVIDVMKPASLGFVIPGMRDEYGVGDARSPGCRSPRCAAPWSARFSGAGSPTSTAAGPRSCSRR